LTQVGWSGLSGTADLPLPPISTIAAIMRAGYGWLAGPSQPASHGLRARHPGARSRPRKKTKAIFGLGPPFKTGMADRGYHPLIWKWISFQKPSGIRTKFFKFFGRSGLLGASAFRRRCLFARAAPARQIFSVRGAHKEPMQGRASVNRTPFRYPHFW
jgi:hypothetical protein